MTNPFINTITINDFKDQFYRDFTYVDDWAIGSYNTGDKVFYLVNNKFYEAKADGITSTPDTFSDWNLLSPSGLVSSKDINIAFSEAKASFNDSITSNEDDLKLIYLYCSAHYLVNDLNANGVDSTSTNPVNSRSVGNVSESYSIPAWMLESPLYSFYTKTSYGLKYLNLIQGYLIGVMGIAQGGTNA
jgi:hypothetical protein